MLKTEINFVTVGIKIRIKNMNKEEWINENLLKYTKLVYGDNFKTSQQDLLEQVLKEAFEAGLNYGSQGSATQEIVNILYGLN